MLNVLRNHFDALSTPKNDPMFNEANYTHVTENVHNWTTGNDTSIFLENPFTKAEVLKVISKLNSGKVPGHDGISSEHLKYAGEFVAHVLCIIFNACVEIEYIPCNFRRGIQVPLYKGKNDGLFFQLHKIGITGSLWRLLYKGYINFECCVRIGSRVSDNYNMDCGIHQGGYLSLVKYTAYIDSLIAELEASNLCSEIFRIKTSPVGYADDLAASTTSKQRMGRVMNMVHQHGCDWRYNFNASKSAVLIFGESERERKIGLENRRFSLGSQKVKERLYYDHVGVKTCVKGDTHVRTEEKVKKARKVLNMSTNMGVKRGGLNLNTCNLIYWTIVMPTLLFGCEVWVIKQRDCDMLEAFQRYAARRLQRFHMSSYNVTSFFCMGWMSIVQYMHVKQFSLGPF